jgi:hypothetical protein
MYYNKICLRIAILTVIRVKVEGSIILKQVFRKWDGGMNWADLAPDRDTWRVLVNVVMKFRGH